MARKPPTTPPKQPRPRKRPLPDAELRDLLLELTDMVTRMTTMAHRLLTAAQAEGFRLTSPEAQEARRALRRLQRTMPKLEQLTEEYAKRVGE